jgi:hypothetical protein
MDYRRIGGESIYFLRGILLNAPRQHKDAAPSSRRHKLVVAQAPYIIPSRSARLVAHRRSEESLRFFRRSEL